MVEQWGGGGGDLLELSVHVMMSLSSAGIGRTGAFCSLSTAIERVKAEGIVDVFHIVKHLRTQRPHMVQSAVSRGVCVWGGGRGGGGRGVCVWGGGGVCVCVGGGGREGCVCGGVCVWGGGGGGVCGRSFRRQGDLTRHQKFCGG